MYKWIHAETVLKRFDNFEDAMRALDAENGVVETESGVFVAKKDIRIVLDEQFVY